MATKKNRLKLIGLMDKYRVKGPKVAAMTGRKLETVHVWRSLSGVDIPNHLLQLLELKLVQEAETGGAIDEQ